MYVLSIVLFQVYSNSKSYVYQQNNLDVKSSKKHFGPISKNPEQVKDDN